MSAATIADTLKVSQPTVSRLLKGNKNIVRIGGGRSARYGMHRDAGLSQPSWPLYHIDENGRAIELGILHALCGGQQGLWWLEGAAEWPILRRGEFKNGVYEDLPWFLYDKRPQGYFGRGFAHQVAAVKGYPSNPTKWTSNQILWSLLEHGYDLPGAFVLGDLALRQWQGDILNLRSGDRQARASDYALDVKKLQAKEAVGSSAGGEQPKFTAAYKDEVTGEIRHVIVKFSPSTHLQAGERWADLLYAEHRAIELLGEVTGNVLPTCVLSSGHRVFLESLRFDRISERGRRMVVSLEAIDAAFLGMNGSPWTAVAIEMLRQGLITPSDADTMAFYWHFGCLIGNNDMHFGNLSFFLNPDAPLEICPLYDMLPMLYAPTANSEIVEQKFQPRAPLPREREMWLKAADVAIEYWQKLASSNTLSKKFNAIADANALTVVRLKRSVQG